MSLWYPDAVPLPFAHVSGGSMLGGGPPRGVLHTTEKYGYTPSTDNYYGHRNPPHITLDVNSGKMYQHYPFNVAARSLKNLKGGVQTNRQGSVNVQVEIAWKAAEIRKLPDSAMDQLREFLLWCRDELGIPFETTRRFVGSEGYGFSTPYRMTAGEWIAYTGWCGHQHVDENNHWNPGRLDTEKLFSIPPPTPEGAYSDEDTWERWAKPSIKKAIARGAIVGGTVNGKKVWNPNGTVTRDQLAVVLDRLGLLEER